MGGAEGKAGSDKFITLVNRKQLTFRTVFIRKKIGRTKTDSVGLRNRTVVLSNERRHCFALTIQVVTNW